MASRSFHRPCNRQPQQPGRAGCYTQALEQTAGQHRTRGGRVMRVGMRAMMRMGVMWRIGLCVVSGGEGVGHVFDSLRFARAPGAHMGQGLDR